MKLFALLVGLLGSLCAAPIGNPSFPSIVQKGLFVSRNETMDLRAGYEGDFVIDGNVQQYDWGQGDVDTYKQWNNSASLTINAINRLDLYAILGASNTKANWRFENPSNRAITRITLETDTDFLWAAGARALLCEWFNTALGMGGRYSSCMSHSHSFASNGVNTSQSGAEIEFKEWQINMDVSYRIHVFIPYIGAKYLNAKTRLKGFTVPISASLTGNNSFKNGSPVGVYLGCTLSSGCYFMFNIEGRLIDEDAITVSGEFRF